MKYEPIDRDQLYFCGYCGQRYVIPLLARDCERKHERADSPEA